MRGLNELMASQLSEREAIIYLMVNSGMTYREVAKTLGISHSNANTLYRNAQDKLEQQGNLTADTN